MNRTVSAILACMLLATPLAAVAQDRFSLSAERVAIYNLVGDVRIERGTGANVIVEVTRQGGDAADLEVRRTDRDGWQALVVHYPGSQIVYPRKGLGRLSRTEFGASQDGTFGLGNLDPDLGTERVTARAEGGRRDRRVRVVGSGSGVEAHADLRILVPAGKVVAIHLGVGTVTGGDITGDLQIDAHSGSVNVVDTKGFLRIDTGSGAIEVAHVTGDVALHTGSGEIEATAVGNGILRIDTGSGAVDLQSISAPELSVTTGSGSIEATGLAAPNLKLATGSGAIRTRGVKSSKFDVHSGSGSIHLDLIGDIDIGRVNTGSGGVTISTAQGLGTEITLDTGSGGIDIEVPMQVMEKRKSFVRGRIGDGAGSLTVGTGSGSIALR